MKDQTIEPWNLATMNQARVREMKYEVAVLPTGAIEPHNLHLPYGQDWFHTNHVARESCRLASEKVEGIALLPAIPYGVDCNLMAFPMTMHVSQATLDQMVRELIESLRTHGIRKIVLLNGHGGNDFIPLARQIQSDQDVYLFLSDWWKVGLDRYGDIFENPDDHAGELETSIALSLYPNLAECEKAGSGIARPWRFEALTKGWVRSSRDFSRVNDQCGVGVPDLATAEKGQAYLDLVCERLSQFLVELAQSPIDEYFPHEG